MPTSLAKCGWSLSRNRFTPSMDMAPPGSRLTEPENQAIGLLSCRAQSDLRAMSAQSFERIGVLAAIVSSALGGIAGGATRFVIEATDPVTLGVFRFGTGFLLLLPIALVLRSRWPRGRDWIGV